MVVTCFCGESYDDADMKARAKHAWCDWQPAAEMAEERVRDTEPSPPPEECAQWRLAAWLLE